MKLSKRKYQTVTQVKVSSRENYDIKEADSFHLLESKMSYSVKVRNDLLFRGLSPQYGIVRQLNELGRPVIPFRVGVITDDLKRRESEKGKTGVGLIHSKGVVGVMPCERIKPHLKGLAGICRGEVKHISYQEARIYAK